MKTKKSKKIALAAQLEVERKFRISSREYAGLQAKLERNGYGFDVASVITDVLLPCKRGVTHRVRREQFLDRELSEVVRLDTYKEHPKLPNGQHVRRENEAEISIADAETLITNAIHRECMPLPQYSKLRRNYVGKLDSYDLTVSLDIAQGLGRYSGHYIEFEILLPDGSTHADVEKAGAAIVRFARRLLSGNRNPVKSYRKMLLSSWGMRS